MRTVLFILLLSLLPASLRAQVLHLRRSGLTAESIRWGFDPAGTTMPAECYAPVTVTVSAGNAAVQGVLVLEYPQDVSQNARIVAPFATTPNAATQVQLLACLPRNCEWAKLTMTDDDGNKQSVEFRSLVLENALPTITGGVCMIGLVGGLEVAPSFVLATDPRALGSWPEGTTTGSEPPPPRWWETAQAFKIDAMPDSWIAYESFDVVVAREQDILQAPAGVREALHTWVEAGGRLIVQASQAGPRTHEALPPGAGACFTIDQPLELTPGAQVQAAMMASSKAQTSIAPARTPVRLLRVTPAGRALGWTTRYPVTDGDGDSGLVASGPVGLGLVTVVGMNPRRVCGIDVNAHDSLWREIIFPALPHWHAGPLGRHSWYGWSHSSGPDMATSMAIRGALDSVTTTVSVGAGFFVVTLIAIAALGLVIGPVGRIVLKRKGWLSSNWLVALGCIAATSAAGLVIPKLLRSGETAVSRWAAVDAVCDADGGVSQAWTTAVTGIFAGRPGSTEVPASADADAIPGGVWWRGVSTLATNSVTGSRQAEIGLLTVPGGAGQRQGLDIGPVGMGQWTHRAFLDQRASPPAELANLSLSLAREDGVFVLRVRGLPPACRVEQGSVLLPGQESALIAVGDGSPDAASGVVLLRGDTLGPRAPLDRFTPEEVQWNETGQYGAETRLVAANASMPVQRGRNAAIETRLDAGGVCVRLHLTNLPLAWDASRWRPATTRHEVWLRAVLPASSVRGYTPEPTEEPAP